MKPQLSQSIGPLLRNSISSVTPAVWRKCCEHARKEEEKDRFLFNRSFIDIDPALGNIIGDDSEEEG